MSSESEVATVESDAALPGHPPAIAQVLEQCEELKSCQISISLRLSSLLRLREITAEQKESVDALQSQLSGINEALAVLFPLLPSVVQPVASVSSSPTVPHSSVTPTSKVITKFPAELEDFFVGTTIIPQWFDHTETVLKIYNFPDESYIRCLLKQTAHTPTIMKWVKKQIFDEKLSWSQAKKVFADKYEIICAEERHLDSLWDISYKKMLTTSDFMSQIETLCKEAGLDHDQFWVVSYALKKMDPAVVTTRYHTEAHKQPDLPN